MRRALQLTALLAAAGALVGWLTTGAQRGWTKTSVPVKTVDELTGLEAITYEKRFVMGLEVLGGVWLGAGALAGASFLFRKQTKRKHVILINIA